MTAALRTLPAAPSAEPPPGDAMAAALAPFDADCDLARALGPLLRALGWDGDPRALAEALPHFTRRLDLTGLRDAMALLGYASSVLADGRADRVDPRLFPALLVPRRGPAVVVLGTGAGPDGAPCPPGAAWVHDPDLGRPALRPLRRLRGDICLFDRTRPEPLAGGFTAFVAGRFRGLYARVFGLTFAIYLLAVAPALFIMAVYDRVIPAQSVSTLGSLLIGAACALAGEAVLRLARGRWLAHLGGRLGLLLTGGLFARLLALPVTHAERMRMGARVQRLRQSGGVAQALAGPAALTVIELPFAAIFLVVLALIAGPLALVPLAAVPVYGLAALVLAPGLRASARRAARTAQARQDFLFETIAHTEALRLSGTAPRWQERFRTVSGEAAHAGYRAQALAALVTAVGQIVMAVAGLLTVGLGALAMMDGALSMGALIAVMTLTWRALMPIQAAFGLLTRLEQLRATVAAIDQAMAAPQEACGTTRRKDVAPIPEGRITLQRVSFKYAAELDPAAVAITAEIAAGEIVAVTGPNGAGKSTLLRLLLGLHQPQAGSILIDGIDIRQHAPIALRQAIGHVPQEPELFFGTLEQNLRLSMPTASTAELEAAITAAGIAPLVRRLPAGLAHRVGDGRDRLMSASLRNGLALAAAYLRRPRLLLLDEAIDNLDADLTAAFHDRLGLMRGHVTTVMVTHRPATMRLADRVIVLNGGAIVRNAPPSELL